MPPPLYIARNGQFPPNFDPQTVSVEPWGTVTFTFSDRDHASAVWTTTYPGFNNGSLQLTRLSTPANGSESAQGQLAACHSGTWYNAQQSGHGLMVEMLGTLPSRQLLAVW